MTELESDSYDVVVIGTGLAESIAAASLAKVGKTVLHIDPNEYYGGEQASLTLDELVAWAAARSISSDPSSSRSTYLSAQRRRYTRATTSSLTPALESNKRRYAISLFPTILPSRGSLISTLIASDVSKYVSFRLLDSVGIWSEGDEGATRTVKKVPGSKEEVFKDKSIGLFDKRRLMKFLMFAAGEFEQDPVMTGREDQPLLDFLEEAFLIPETLAESITYAIAHCNSPSDSTLPALIRTRRYLKSIGRYGSSAFLVGQYGGAGEVAQGFCRACAVHAGTYVLGASGQPESIDISDSSQDLDSSPGHVPGSAPSADIADLAPITLKLPCHPRPISTQHLISSPAYLPQSTPNSDLAVRTATAHCVAILPSLPDALKKKLSRAVSSAGEDSSSLESDEDVTEDDTAVVVFPPVDGGSVVRALIMGEGTGSCPPGQFILYLTQEVSTASTEDTSPQDVLKTYLYRLAPTPLFEAYYYSHQITPTSPPTTPSLIVLSPYNGTEVLTEGLDWEAEQGRLAFQEVMNSTFEGERRGFFEKITEEREDLDDEDDL